MRNVETTLRKSLWPVGVPSLLVALFAVGCAEPQRAVHVLAGPSALRLSALKPGDTMPELRFQDADGNATRLGMVRGRVTVVLLQDDPDEWPSPEVYRRCRELARQSSGSEIPVAILNIGQPKPGWAEAVKALQTDQVTSDQVILVGETEDAIRPAVGSIATGKFYILDNYNQITEVGEFMDVDSLRDPIERAVRKVAEEDSQIDQHG